MINKNDFSSYLDQNKEFLIVLKENAPSLYDRFHDVIAVLNHIGDSLIQGEKNNEELRTIFEVGFSFFYEELEEIKLYYDIYLKCNKQLLNEFSMHILFILYLNDLKEILIDKKIFTLEIDNAISNFSDTIDGIIKKHSMEDNSVLDEINNFIESNVPIGTLTTPEVFALIAEELRI